MSDLYNALEKLRYPEVAQINREEFESTILTGNKRVELLHWLLQENPKFNCSLLDKIKEPTLEGKLLKCYSQMGFCNSEDILLGKCKIDEQLNFLSLLTLFIKRMYSSDSELFKSDKEAVNCLLKVDTIVASSEKVCIKEEERNVSGDTNFTEDSKSLQSSNINTIHKQKSDFDNMCSNIKLILEESIQRQDDNYEPKLQKMYSSFKNTTSLPVTHPTQFSDDFNTDIEQIQTTFSVINKALINEVEFSNRLVPEITDKTAKPLSLILKNNVVLIEQACNMLKENQKLS